MLKETYKVRITRIKAYPEKEDVGNIQVHSLDEMINPSEIREISLAHMRHLPRRFHEVKRDMTNNKGETKIMFVWFCFVKEKEMLVLDKKCN